MTFGIKKTPQGFELRGHLDETAVFPPVDVTSAPLLLNFRQVTGINSLGVQRYLGFVDAWHGRPVEYHNCPTPMVDALLMLPALLGPEENTAQLKSFQVPFSCLKCKEAPHLLVQDSDIAMKGGALVMPPRACPRCSTFLKPSDLVHDYIVFVETGALRVKKL